MTNVEQIEIEVLPLNDMEPIGDGNRRARHRVCGAEITFRRNIAPPDTYSLACPNCGRIGDIQQDEINSIDREAIFRW